MRSSTAHARSLWISAHRKFRARNLRRNSERNMNAAERITSVDTMARNAPVQSVYAIHRMHLRNVLDCEIASSGEVADCKTRDFLWKSGRIRDCQMSGVAEREKNCWRRVVFVSAFSRHNVCFTYSRADNLLPRDPAPVPKPRPGYLNRRLPTAVPTRSPAVLFSFNWFRLRVAFPPRHLCLEISANLAASGRCPAGGHIARLRRHLCASLLAIFAAAVSVALSGCWMAAAQFAPLAANLAEDVGGGALELAAGVGASTHAEATRAREEEDERQSAMNSGDNCDQLEVEVPDVIELRRSATGAPEYRELEISDSLAQRQWLPLTDRETTPDGWQPAVNFLQMNFSPPLGAVVPET